MSMLPALSKTRALARTTDQDDVARVLGAFESETVAVFARTAPRRQHLVLYTLAGMMFLSVVLAAVVKLDRVVAGTGRIAPIAGAIYVSPFDTGVVRQVLVRTGDVVKKGQVLATLDATFTQADVKQLSEKRASDEAIIARDEAELSGRPYAYSEGNSYQAMQGGLWRKRKAQYDSDLADFDARIRSAEAQVAQYRSDLAEYTKRLKLASDTEKMLEPLLAKGLVSKLQVMQASDQKVELSRLAGDAQNQMDTQSHQASSLRAQRESYIQKWHSDTTTEMVTARNDLDITRQGLSKAQRMNELIQLTAPQDAVVLKVAKVSQGAVATGGGSTQSVAAEPLFTLVPLDSPLQAEVQIPAEDIGFVKAGQHVEIKLDAYRYLEHGTAKGRVKTVSEGSFTTNDDGQPTTPYFKAIIEITDFHLRKVPSDFRLIPGMTLSGEVLVGKRTILSYLVEGALRTGDEAMREPN